MGLKPVTREEFFSFMNPRDVHPTVVSEWADDIGYRTEWRTPGGRVLGVSDSLGGGRYWLSGEVL